MVSARNVRIPALVALLPLLLLAPSVGAQDQAPATDWKVFQEFGFLNGSWSGPAWPKRSGYGATASAMARQAAAGTARCGS